MHNSVYNQRLARLSGATVAGQTTVNSDAVDARGFSGVEFAFVIGAITATGVVTCKVQGSDDNATWTDVEGASVALDDSQGASVVRLEVYKPRTRYLRGSVVRTVANSAVEGIFGLSNLPNVAPVKQDASVAGVLVVNNPYPVDA